MQTYIISTVIKIPQNIEVGKLVGRDECNLKPIGGGTVTLVCVNKDTTPAQIEIKYNIFSLPPSNNQINEAKSLVNNLIAQEERRVRSEKKKEKKKEKNVPFLSTFIKDGSGGRETSKYLKEITVKKERRQHKREIDDIIKLHLEGRGEMGGM